MNDRIISDADALDELAAYLRETDQWNGGDFCEIAAVALRRTGRSIEKTPFTEVVRLCPGFNEVSASITPNGELTVCLSHRNCNDDDVMLRVSDVVLVSEAPPGAWGDDNHILGRLNHGGNWDA